MSEGAGQERGFEVRAVVSDDRPAVERLVSESWGGPTVVVDGEVIVPHELDGFLAVSGADVVGLVTYRTGDECCEIVTLDAFAPGSGVGTALVQAVAAAAREAGCSAVSATTTNDNLDALRFYQRLGFRLVALRPGAVDRARAVKPSIPALGWHDLPIRDEIELESEL